jgi:hypothetical protein
VPTTSHLVDVEAANISHDSDGWVVVDDPDSPWVVRVWAAVVDGRARIVGLRVDAKHCAAAITSARLGRLPTGQLLHLAVAEAAHPNELFYRMLAQPKAPGRRGWDEDHWGRVLQVHEWAVQSGRPGGGVRAIADMWGIAINPTAYRWLAQARRRAKGEQQ